MTAPELRIVGGTVVDGTGAPGRPETVEVIDGRVRLLEDEAAASALATPAGRTIDATGKVIVPGFIDLHSHGGLMILADGRHEPKVRQGVTTELIGVDGNGFAPFARREDLEAFVELDSGLDGRPPIDYDWRSVDDFLTRFDGAVSLNVATLVGNSQLRIAALGWDDVPADARALDTMRGLLRDAMAEGAFGLSTGLDYPPGSFATTDELAALTAEAGRHGGFYHTHVRYPLGDRYLDPFREAIDIGRRAGAPAHITHFYHRATYPGGPGPMLALVDDARAEGLDVTFDTYPSEWASTRLLIQLPQWIQAGGPGPLKQRLADRSARDRVRAEFTARGASYASAAGWADVRLGAFRRPENLRWESHTVADVMAETGHDALDVICDLLLSEDLGVSQVTSGPAAETLRPFVAHPVGMVGTDSTFLGDKPSPRTYGSFPRILGQFVRDEALLSLEEAVRKMTSAPAARLGLRDRGVIRDGAVADLVVFDPDTVRSTATYDEPRSYPIGIEQVIVAGTLVVADGVHTGATPGRGLRRARD
ncbi:MAG TPA: amidohydrolase family protein [Candidatus Limnocylindrales bacterium]|nr:amidohydrolase family protein [Candidatus Limnocylindrales bacterium]